MIEEPLTMEPKDRPGPRWSLGSGSGLNNGSSVKSFSSLTPKAEEQERPALSPRRANIAVAVLCYINLLNFTERYTISGVLPNIQKFFDISDSIAALIQTVFTCSVLLLAPLFGYLGDRYNRKYIMIGSLCVWLVTAVGSSFVTESYFWLLMLLRAMVGIGEASCTTIAPTIISDLFVGAQRSKVVCVFYIFGPVGCGLGYIIGAGVATLTGDWRWALRITPILGVVGIVLLVFLCPNPPRGAAETQGEGVTGESSYLDDIKYLMKNKSYVWSTLGVTATASLSGALAFWMPTFLSRARINHRLHLPCVKELCNPIDSYIFGAVMMVTGALGGSLGSGLSRWFGDKVPKADPIICAVGLLASAPCIYISIVTASASIPATYVFIFFSETLFMLNWSVMMDILLSVIIPTRRSSAVGFQTTICHLLGDAVSPYIVGAISDAVRNSKPATYDWSFRSLMYSLLVCPFVAVLGGLFFLMTSAYIIEDRKAAAQLVIGDLPPQQRPASEPPMELSNGGSP
ncbi:protein spinster homolog 3-like [Sebastes fasciatus]|uniref:protein spinster homolog 3-like n=1 Tax=Sebastes fasciatus TaxID=394691 RepID=UPI003D9E62AF